MVELSKHYEKHRPGLKLEIYIWNKFTLKPLLSKIIHDLRGEHLKMMLFPVNIVSLNSHKGNTAIQDKCTTEILIVSLAKTSCKIFKHIQSYIWKYVK